MNYPEREKTELPFAVKAITTAALAFFPSFLNRRVSKMEGMANFLEGAGLTALGLSQLLGELLGFPVLREVINQQPLLPNTHFTLPTAAVLVYLTGRALELGGLVSRKRQ